MLKAAGNLRGVQEKIETHQKDVGGQSNNDQRGAGNKNPL